MKKTRKKYRIRRGSPLDLMIGAIPFGGMILIIVLAGLMTSQELGLL